jgi:diacylglycerol kinase
MDQSKEQKNWREIKYTRKFSHAFRGLRVLFVTTNHLIVHMLTALCVVGLGLYFGIPDWQWVALSFAIGFVFVAEAFNTAIEIDIDLTSPEYHPYARDTKDVAAAAVLLSVLTAIIVGLVIFIPYIFIA